MTPELQGGIYAREFCVVANDGYRAAMGKSVARKIRELRISLGQNQSEFAARMGVTQATVSRWEKGAMPEPLKLAQLSELAGQDVKSFIDEQGANTIVSAPDRYWVRGAVAAGVWREAFEWPQEEQYDYSGGDHITVSKGSRFGLLVEGESMSMIYPPGTVLDCVSVEELGEPKSGQRVIVIRTRFDGSVEATVKEFMVSDDGRRWLVPRSYNPAFQNPIPADEPQDGVVDSRVIAIVVGSYRPE